jgi:CRP-like cAMP-binding protein
MSMISPDVELEAFEQIAVAPGDFVFLEGQPGDTAFVILKGEVQAGSQGPDSNFIVLSRMYPGEIFGEIALVTVDGARTASVMSEGGCQLLVIPRSVFVSRLGKADRLLNFIIVHLCRRLVALSKRVVTAGLEEP